MKKIWPIFAVAVGGFFVWQFLLGRQSSALFKQNAEHKDAQARSANALNAAQFLTPALAVVSALKAGYEGFNQAPTAYQSTDPGNVEINSLLDTYEEYAN